MIYIALFYLLCGLYGSFQSIGKINQIAEENQLIRSRFFFTFAIHCIIVLAWFPIVCQAIWKGFKNSTKSNNEKGNG